MNFKLFLLLTTIAATATTIDHCQWHKVDTNGYQRCTVCQTGYMTNLNYSQCNPCTQLHPQCLRCHDNPTSQLECQLCDYGYYLSNNTCLPYFQCSSSNCLICMQTDTCDYCQQGYFLNYTTKQCQDCPYPDMYDTYNEQCSCDFGHYLDSSRGSCQKCSYPCQQCWGTSDNCTRCAYGYGLQEQVVDKCWPCLVPNCILCSSSVSICDNCTLGYTLTSQNSCQVQLQTLNIQNYINLPQIYYFCQEGCFYCYKYDFCLTCLQGYERDVRNDSCIPCGIGCAKCQIQDSGVQCLNCQKGYRIDPIQMNCRTCSHSCKDCDQLGCRVCETGYTVVNGECLACAANCLKCDEEGPGRCDAGGCESRYARVNVMECALCALGCYSCSSVDISTCLSCPLGSFQIEDGQCRICPSGCTTCTGSETCTACRDSYRLVQNKCLPTCNYPCLECSPYNPNICSSCFRGYQLTQDYTCQPDISCANNNTCQICPLGYYLTPLKECLTCETQPHCLKCQTESSRCVICQPGYYPLEHTCRSCSQECETCQLFDRCFTCKAGHYLQLKDSEVYGSCLECSADCQTCINEPQKCNSCSLDKELIGFSCITSQNIIFQLTLQHNSILEESSQEIALIKEIGTFTKYVAQALGQPFASEPDLLYVKDISSGSVKITYMASTKSLDPRVLLNNVQERLPLLTSFGEFQVIGSEIVANGFQEDKSIEAVQSILYISLVPAPLLCVLMVISLCHLLNRKQVQQVSSQTPESKVSDGREIKLQPLDSQKNLKGDRAGAITL